MNSDPSQSLHKLTACVFGVLCAFAFPGSGVASGYSEYKALTSA